MTVWPKMRLGEVAEVVSGPAFESNAFTDSPVDFRLLRGINVGVGEIKWNDVKYWPREPADAVARFQLRAGDVVLAMDRPWIKAGLKIASVRDSDLPALLVQRVARLRAKDSLVQGFLRAVTGTQDFREYLRGITGGTTVPHISANDIRGFLIYVPPSSTQHRIGGIVAAFDELIEINERRIELLEDLARSLYREWFVHFRFPGREATRIVKSKLGSIPEGWNPTTLSRVASITMGQSPQSEFYNDAGEGLPFHQGVSDFGKLLPTHSKYCTSDMRTAERLDVLCSVRAPVGRLNLAGELLGIGRGLSSIRRNDGSQAFLLMQIRQALGDEDSIGGGTIFKAIGKGQLADLSILEPEPGLVMRFEAVARLMLDLRIELTSQNQRYATTRDLLFPRLVSGQLDISDTDLGILTPAETE